MGILDLNLHLDISEIGNLFEDQFRFFFLNQESNVLEVVDVLMEDQEIILLEDGKQSKWANETHSEDGIEIIEGSSQFLNSVILHTVFDSSDNLIVSVEELILDASDFRNHL